MKLIVLPNNSDFILPFYLAVEEWIARCMPADEYFFAWQVDRSIICGRNQVISLEVDRNFCIENNIAIWRRKSGGGAVYADRSNVMFSYITPHTGVEPTFECYINLVRAMLASLGIEAKPSGRNDIEIDGRKVAGNAFYVFPERSIVHGTMLYDADLPTMSKALTPSRAKLSARGVKSVPARITTLRQHGLSISCPEFIDYATNYLCDSRYELTPADIEQVNEIMRGYISDDFLADRAAVAKHSRRIEGVGDMTFSCTVGPDRRIHNPQLLGDFFELRDVQTHLLAHLEGVELRPEPIANILAKLNVEQTIAGLHSDQMLEIILN